MHAFILSCLKWEEKKPSFSALSIQVNGTMSYRNGHHQMSDCRLTISQKADKSSKSDGGFFLACEDFGRMFDNSFPACAFFVVFLLVDFSSRTLIPLLRPRSVHSGSACDRVFPDELRVSSFPDRFPHYAWTAA